MPIYEYRCEDCRHELERIQRVADAPLDDCPQCGRASLRRLVSAPRFRLKGSGWYETDFKKEGRRNLADSAGGEDKSAASGSETKAESGKADAKSKAPATKTESPKTKTKSAGNSHAGN